MHVLIQHELSIYMISHCKFRSYQNYCLCSNCERRVQPVGIQICSATHCNPSNISRLIQYKQVIRDVMPCSLVDKRDFSAMHRACTFRIGGKGMGISEA
jgi:hypothetical protein